MTLIRILLKIIYRVVIGGVVIFLFNLIGDLFSINIALNAISALLIGFLGAPGLILLIALKTIL